MTRLCCLPIALLFCLTAAAYARTWTVESPNGKVHVDVRLAESGTTETQLSYSVTQEPVPARLC
jgi:hypothetical protein